VQHSPYVIISPMKNEERYVAQTLDSVVGQTAPPLEWVIVNDGSTDRSPDIVSQYARQYPWIRLVHSNASKRSRGGHVVDLFYKGFEHIKAKHFDFIVKLDCDLSFAGDFFAVALQHLDDNPRLGVTSGISHIMIDGQLVAEGAAPGHTLGASKIYRYSCFQDIGGLVRSMGWDGIDEIKARMLGWEARPIRELVVLHHRPEGKQLGTFASGLERGRGSYFMGYHPMFLMARVCRQILRPRHFVDGIAMFAGYTSALLKREERIPDSSFINFLRKHQLRKLLMLKSEV